MIKKYERLATLLENRQFADFRKELAALDAVDIASFLEFLPRERAVSAFRLIPKDLAAEVVAKLDGEVCTALISEITAPELRRILEDLYIDDVVDMLEELPAGLVSKIMKAATPETRETINRFLSFPEGSTGSVMTAEFLTLRKTLTVENAIRKIRAQGEDKETVHVVYITDENRVLEGTLDLSELIFAPPDVPIGALMNTNVIYAVTTEDQESAAEKIARYDLLALPVVDSENRLVGIFTVDDAMDVVKEEATEDIEKMAAITPTDKPYLKTGVFSTYIKRVPWLLLLMISATFTGAIITHYEDALGAYVVLTAFIPMLMDTGGNAGGQASVTVIRGLSLGELQMRDWFLVVWKELRVALLCGASLAAISFGKLLLLDRVGVAVAATVSITLLATVLVAKLIGSALPIFAKRIGLDPAVMASPFITTIVDALSLLIYFRIACTVLHIS